MLTGRSCYQIILRDFSSLAEMKSRTKFYVHQDATVDDLICLIAAKLDYVPCTFSLSGNTQDENVSMETCSRLQFLFCLNLDYSTSIFFVLAIFISVQVIVVETKWITSRFI